MDRPNNGILLTIHEARTGTKAGLCIDTGLGWQTYPHAH